MGLFGLGKKKTPAEILAEGQALYAHGDYEKAATTLLKASGKENGEVDYWIGRCYLIRYEKEEDNGNQKWKKQYFKLAKLYLTFAAKKGHTEAARLLAEQFDVRDYLPDVPKPAQKLEEDPAPQTDLQPCDKKRQAHLDEVKSPLSAVEQKQAEAQKQEVAKAAQKQAEARKRETAEAAQKQRDENIEWNFKEGVAAYKDRDYEKALYIFAALARQGYAEAQYNCGLMYDRGEGMTTDKAKALYWYEKAAEQGHVKAQFNCGLMYDSGEGTVVDKAKALYWYEKAAEQGIVQAQYNCGVMYSHGAGTTADKAKALYWYEKAAEQGDTKAQFSCGMMYNEGEGAAIDKEKALYWYKKAVQNDAPSEEAVMQALLKYL